LSIFGTFITQVTFSVIKADEWWHVMSASLYVAFY